MRVLIISSLIGTLIFLACGQSNSDRTLVQRHAALIRVKPEFRERYIILHKHAFPGVLQAIEKANIHNYSIFLHRNLLFSYFEYTGTDFKADMAEIAKDSTSQDWWKLTDPMQSPLPTRQGGEWWASMDSVFNLPFKPKASVQSRRIAMISRTLPGHMDKVQNLVKRAPSSLAELAGRHALQNISFYAHADWICLYFEYSGHQYSDDTNALLKNPVFKTWSDKLSTHLCGRQQDTWSKMHSVFYTP